jgi:DNA-binding response OmpR family regulator
MAENDHILLIEDDARLAELIRDYLSQQGYCVSVEERGDEGRRRIVDEQPQLVILDLMLPGMDGLSICREVRQNYLGPILMLTAKEDDTDQIVGLEIGADDYVKKPVEPRVLLARIRSLLRRVNSAVEAATQKEESRDVITYGGLIINKASRTAILDARDVELTTNEFSLLWLLAENVGKTLDRETLFKEVRGISYDGIDRSVDITISRLRKKLGDNSAKPWRIKTVWGQGYLFVENSW